MTREQEKALRFGEMYGASPKVLSAATDLPLIRIRDLMEERQNREASIGYIVLHATGAWWRTDFEVGDSAAAWRWECSACGIIRYDPIDALPPDRCEGCDVGPAEFEAWWT